MAEKEISIETVATKILLFRGKRVMLDSDLARLYGVETFNLNKAVKRNIERFPEDFMFQLSVEENNNNMIFQNGMSSWGGRRHLPYVFTEQGVAMLSSVLSSKRAVQVNIAIMRAFVKLRELLLTNKELAEKVSNLERKSAEHDSLFVAIFEAIKQLSEPPPVPNKPKIGFNTQE